MIPVNFISSKDAEEGRLMHSNSDNLKFKSYNVENEVVEETLWATLLKISRKFRNINERELFYFWFSSTYVLQFL